MAVAGAAWESYKAGEEVEVGTEHPAKANLQRGRQKLGIVAMLIERRTLVAAMPAGEIKALSVYTDASPICGVELQGLVIDMIWVTGEASVLGPEHVPDLLCPALKER